MDPPLFRLYAANPQDLSLFKAMHYFQSIMTCLINLSQTEDVQVLGRSDDGACLNVGRSAFFTDHNIQPAGNGRVG